MSLDERIFSGTWYQVARYGPQIDLFTAYDAISWVFINKNCGYFSIKINAKSACLDDVFDGFATFSQPDGKLDITVYLSDGIYSLEYYLLYTDYVNYALIGKPNNLIILSRRNTIISSEVPILIMLAEKHGYDGSRLFVTTGAILTTTIPSQIPISTISYIKQEIPEKKVGRRVFASSLLTDKK